MDQLFYANWQSLLRTLVIGVTAYAGLILLLRISGKRTLSKMNAFDFIVTVALGSTLATMLLSKDIALAQGMVAFAVLILLQFLITWTSVRAKWVRTLVTGEPSLLLHKGEPLPKALLQTRITKEELGSAIRSAGLSSFHDAESVILETDGSFSVIPRSDKSKPGELVGVTMPTQSQAKAN